MESGHQLALALGGGAAYGYAHIGVLRALEQHGITPDLVVGTSFGAVVGALWAAGYSADELSTLASGTRLPAILRLLFDPALPPRPPIKGGRLEAFYDALFMAKGMAHLEDFPTPFAAVCVDLEGGRKVLVTKGRAGRAVRASGSIPGIFAPVEWGRHLLVDGGVLELVPWRSALALGGRRVLAVDVSTDDLISRILRLTRPLWHTRRGLEPEESCPRGELVTSIAHLRRSAAVAATITTNSAQEDPLPGVVIHLKVNSGISTVGFSRAAPAICAGELAALEIIDDLRSAEDVHPNGVE